RCLTSTPSPWNRPTASWPEPDVPGVGPSASRSETSPPPVAAPTQPTPRLQGARQMANRPKAYQAVAEKIVADVNYEPAQAIALAKETSVAKYDATVEVALRLGVDPRKADQMVRGTVNLPHGTGKTARVLVFAAGDRAEAAR